MVVDVLHGVEVADPYRWLEDGDAPEVQQWVADQNRFTREALDARPDRGWWHERLLALLRLPVVLAVQIRGDHLFALERPAGAEQFVLTRRSTVDPDAPAVVLLDPAIGTSDAANAVDWFEASDDGRLVAVGTSEGGTEDSVLRVLDATDGRDLGEAIPDTRACSVAWEPDGSGFAYTRYPEGDEYHRTVHHHRARRRLARRPRRVGRARGSTGVARRVDLARRALAAGPRPQGLDPLRRVPARSGDGRLVDGDRRRRCDDQRSSSPPTARHWSASRRTEPRRDGSCGCPLGETDPDAWTTIVAERDDAVLGHVSVAGDELWAVTTTRAVDTVHRFAADGTALGTVDGLGDIVAVSGLAADRRTGVVVAVVDSFDAPTTVWRARGADPVQRWFPEPASGGVVPQLSVSQVTYPSLDGTSIGLFLIHRADVSPGPETPAILNGYGGFAIAETPVWSAQIAAWCAAGGVFAIAGLRGGIEEGEAWHHAGRRANKQNVFDDFHAAADWLVDQGLVSRERLAILGRSNGGLLVGAAMTQRPDLCRAVWCGVPLLDMVRFPQFLIARLWTDEYGDPDVAEEFAWLYAYSPYHRVVD